MKKSVLLLAFVLSAAVMSSPAPAAGKLEVKTAGIQIAAAPYDVDDWQTRPFNSRGTAVALLAKYPEAAIIALDTDNCKLDQFTDDTGKDLTEKPKTKQRFYLQSAFSRSHVSKDRHAVLLQIRGASIPAPKAKTIHIKGSVQIKVAHERKTALQKGLKLEEKSKITAGPVEFTLGKVKSTKQGKIRKLIELKAVQEIDHIESIRFLDGEGKEIKSRGRGSSTMRFGNNVNVSKTIGLEKDVDTATVEIKYWDGLETKSIPIDLKAGIGL
ncbi:MAG: hypothetical protein KGZ25_13150 [Planctomycetes bacterium]|nr:hypothetical protein [Planctomycetota bacterium]